MPVTGKRVRVNIMAAVASRGALRFTVLTGRFTTAVFTTSLDRLARHVGRKVHDVTDTGPCLLLCRLIMPRQSPRL